MNDATPTEILEVDISWEWAIVEIFGHRRHVGKAREEERFGSKMLRIDVPKLGPGTDEISWSSHFYGGSSIFSYTITDQETVMNYAQRTYTPALPYRDHGTSDPVDHGADREGAEVLATDDDEDEEYR
ncbi:hypothetical protein LQG66_04035 [Bradyrhizobium ontarionense]|uniref:Uncharacterized protein n=1 Tax=Bradyrhizobium ontarionense TaxID=2898149 RepID=A0ABY3RFD4_9BRAD|nr:hypothetical protein [Bradyrhizobium sp. A19]UFZ05497.1 hypothetical protein LQG66_04035 [Bradyrhizobium sp. A19]